MTKAVRISLGLTITLSIITILPIVAFGIGYVLNDFWFCDIRDEGGEVYGTCTETQSSIVYSLLLMPWFMLITIPFAGIPAAVALLVTIILLVRNFLRSRSGISA